MGFFRFLFVVVCFFFKTRVFEKRKRKKRASVQERHACGGSECQSVITGAAWCPCIWAEVERTHSSRLSPFGEMLQEHRAVHYLWAGAHGCFPCQHSQSCTTSRTKVSKQWPLKVLHCHLLKVEQLNWPQKPVINF